MKIYENITQLIGRTPLVRLSRFSAAEDLPIEIYAKLEYMNPAGSAKDRVASAMIADAEAAGLLKEGTVIVEPTSGNTGIGLAAVAASRGYRVILTMPETMSMERRNLLAAYGAELVLTDGAQGMNGAIKKAQEIAQSLPSAFLAGQFENPANPNAHYVTTGPEIWEDTDGEVDVFVAGVGTGGTLSGVGAFLKEKNPAIQMIAVEPQRSAVISGNAPAPHGLQGIGAGFLPKNLNVSLIDRVIPVCEEDAYRMARQLVQKEGYLVGITSGAALYAATVLAKEKEFCGKRIVALLPDTGERYLSTPLFAKQP